MERRLKGKRGWREGGERGLKRGCGEVEIMVLAEGWFSVFGFVD